MVYAFVEAISFH